jgi:Ca-activated chloride channel family protein
MQDFTSDKELLFAGARKLQVEGGQSAVVDAVYLAVDHVARSGRKDARKAVVLITDGDERTSFYTLDKLVKFLHKAEVPVYVLGVTVKLDKEGIRKSPRRQAESLLGTIAKESRGRLFLPKNVLELEAATNEVLHGLQRQFLVNYHSTSHDASSDFQEVEVKFADQLKAEKQKIIAPRGYWLKPPSLDPDLKKQKTP